MELDKKMEYQPNYGYFIAKTQNSEMDLLSKKFKQVYGEKPTKIRIRFFDETPFTIRNARYNQSGAVCYCMQGEKLGKEKVKNKWQNKECLSNCEYAVSANGQKPVCMQEGTLKFLLPDVSLDRAWLLKIRGITVIDKIYSYISTQNLFGNSIIGDYYLYLLKEKQTRAYDGKSFNNVVLDIIKADSNEVVLKNIETKILEEKNKNETEQSVSKNKKVCQKQDLQVNSVENKVIPIKKEKENDTIENEINFEKCYSFLNIEPIIINKNGKELEYMQGNFIDMKDNQISAIVNDELVKELEVCDLGTILELEFTEKLEKKWIIKSKFVQKCLKKVAV